MALSDRFLLLRIVSGDAFLALGMIGLSLGINATGTALTPCLFIALLLVCAFGMDTLIMSLFQLTMSSDTAEDAGAGSDALQAFQQMGAALGIAISGRIFFGSLGEGGMETGGAVTGFVTAAAHATLFSIAAFAVFVIVVGGTAWKTRKAS